MHTQLVTSMVVAKTHATVPCQSAQQSSDDFMYNLRTVCSYMQQHGPVFQEEKDLLSKVCANPSRPPALGS